MNNDRKRKLLLLFRLDEILSSDEEEEQEKESRDILDWFDDHQSYKDFMMAAVGSVDRIDHFRIPDYMRTVMKYTPDEFISHFRLRANTVHELIERFRNSFHYRSLNGHGGREPISATRAVLMYLWFAGHQSSYRDISDRFDVQLNTLFNTITRISNFLIEMAPEVIRFPTEDEKQRTATHFEIKTKFPNVIGAIDGSHIRIDRPKVDHVSYINRKRYYSIQLQGICDQHSRFLDVFIGYPGSCHDSRVFQESDVYSDMNELCTGNYYILGDSAYPLSVNMMVPFKENGHLTARQKLYNKKLSQCRIVIEHAFGRLKQRFRQLYHFRLRSISRIVKCIHAFCVLHNLGTDEELRIIKRYDEAPVADEVPNPAIPENAADVEEAAPGLVVPEASGKVLRDEITVRLTQ